MRRLFLAFIMLVLSATAAEARWREATSKHFIIYSEAPEAELRRMSEQLERFDALLRMQRGAPDPELSPSRKVTIYQVRDMFQLRDLVGGGGTIGGIYFPRAVGPMILTPRRSFNEGSRGESAEMGRRFARTSDNSFTPQVVLLHEYMHHFMFNNFNFAAPLWFSEGYPELYSTVRFEQDGSLTLGIPPWHRGYELGQIQLDIDDLLLRPTRNYRNPAIYGQGWLISHYLTFAPERQGQFDAYIRALNSGRSFQEAATVLGDLGQLERDIRRHLNSPQLGIATIPASRLPIGPVTIRELTPAEEAMIDVKIQSKRGVNREQAQRVVQQARRAAAPFPNDPNAQLVLAEAELDARNYDAAEAAADRVLAAAPNTVDAHIYKARAIWERAKAAQNRSPEVWREVRARLVEASRLDRGDPEPLMLFYQSFEANGEEPSENAIDGLFRAQNLAREDRELRFMAAREWLNRPEGGPLAAGLLASIANSAHNAERSTQLNQILEKIRAGDVAGARTQLDELRRKDQEEQERREREDD